MNCGVALVLMLSAVACSRPPGSGSAPADASLTAYVLNELPEDVQHRTLIDFEGKLALIGYDLVPVGRVNPGSPVTVRLYWQRRGRLEPGWKLFTHLVDAFGTRKVHVERAGTLAGKFPLESWQIGKVYVDEQNLSIPNDISSEATVLVGAWHAGYTNKLTRPNMRSVDLRLQVISGSDDGQNRGIVAHIDTGKKPAPRWLPRRKS